MGNSCNRARKLTRKMIPNEILEEIREKKRNDMTNRRLSMDTQPIPVVEDATVLPTNPQQEVQNHSLKGPSVSIAVEEQAPHVIDQGVKHRCTSRPHETFANLLGCGYTSGEVRELFNGDCMLKEENVVHTT